MVARSLTAVLFCFFLVRCHGFIPDNVEVFSETSESIFDYRFDIKFKPESTSHLCNIQLKHFQEGIDKHEFWARKMRDAWGNFPSGIFVGSNFDFGNFDECINLKFNTEEAGEVSGQHCTLLIPFEVPPENGVVNAKLATPMRNSSLNLVIGICVPASCSPEDIQALAADAIKSSWNITLSKYNQNKLCSTRENHELEDNATRIFAIIFFAIFLVLVVCSTIYEIACGRTQTKPSPLLAAFSACANSKRIMQTTPMSPKEMLFIHGLRALAIIWIVFGHTFSVDIWNSPSINPTAMLDGYKNVFTMFLLSGFFGVNTFFLLSAMLMTLSVFRELDKTEKINLPILYLKRYFRIAVPLGAAIIFVVGLFSDVSDGPMWKWITDDHVGLCKEWWWTTMLFVSNLVNPGRYCFWHSWYLMADMQLYLLSPLILYPLWRLRKQVLTVVLIIFAVALSTAIFVIVFYSIKDFRISQFSPLYGYKSVAIYTITFGWIDSWMMGILTGYIMHRINDRNVEFSKKTSMIGWTLTTLTMLSLIFGQYPLAQENYNDHSRVFDIVYDSFKGLFWSLSVGWIIIACHLSETGAVKSFLSHPIWLPISKLSFSIYLVHVPIQLINMSSLRISQYFSILMGIYKFGGYFIVSFFVAFAWALIFEYPTLTIIASLVVKRKALNIN